MPLLIIAPWLQSALWGLLSGSALIIGAAIGYFLRVPPRLIGFIMAFGSGVLISALSFDLMDEAYSQGGFWAAAAGFVSGALIYTAANFLVNRKGARHRKRSGGQQQTETQNPGSGLAIAIGALIDGIPESIAIGVSMIEGSAVSLAAVIAIFLSNIPESLSSASGMKAAGRRAGYIFGVWAIITLLSGAAALAGFALFRNLPQEVVAGTLALAAGGILAMLSTTMIPEAFEESHDLAGLITVLGFLTAFILNKVA